MDVLRVFPDNSFDCIVTDPPYGLKFMGKKWDYDVPTVEQWKECLRVLKPGGHLLAFAGTRTQHRMAVRIEDAGFEIRDMIAWVYGSGFPKSLDVSKALDKAAGVEGTFGGPKSEAHAGWVARGRMRGEDGHGGYQRPWMLDPDAVDKNARVYVGGSAESQKWQGWGTALKPALEPITLARKPLIGTVSMNILEHGTGGLNIDGCRVGMDPKVDDPRLGGKGTWKSDKMAKNAYGDYKGTTVSSSPLGRFPANLIHDGSEEVLAGFPKNAGAAAPVKKGFDGNSKGIYGDFAQKGDDGATFYGDKGSAARFFYCAKSSKADRGEGNKHPTVKPTDLMRYLCRLVTPPNGHILDPFMGSGSTGKAAVLENFRFTGIDLDLVHVDIARERIEPHIFTI
jgi:site-specific DNA-methyltransferase (adenine-specific)